MRAAALAPPPSRPVTRSRPRAIQPPPAAGPRPLHRMSKSRYTLYIDGMSSRTRSCESRAASPRRSLAAACSFHPARPAARKQPQPPAAGALATACGFYPARSHSRKQPQPPATHPSRHPLRGGARRQGDRGGARPRHARRARRVCTVRLSCCRSRLLPQRCCLSKLPPQKLLPRSCCLNAAASVPEPALGHWPTLLRCLLAKHSSSHVAGRL